MSNWYLVQARFTLAVLLPLLIWPSKADLTFNFDYSEATDLPAAARSALADAGQLLGSQFQDTADLNVAVKTENVAGSRELISGGFSSFFILSSNNQLAIGATLAAQGENIPATFEHAKLTINIASDFSYGDTVAADEYDFKAIAMGSLLTGLGLQSILRENGDDARGNSPGSQHAPFDRMISDREGNRLIDPDTFLIDLVLWEAHKAGGAAPDNGLFFNGTAARAANGGLPVGLYTPSPFVSGRSLKTLDPNDPRLADLLSLPESNTGPKNRILSAVERGIFTDIGYTMKTPTCSYSLSKTIDARNAEAGSGSVDVSTSLACSWTPVANAPWITILSRGGFGNDTVTYSVSDNTGAERSGTISVGAASLTITQADPSVCFYAVTPATRSFSAAGGSSSLQIESGSGCNWQANETLAWVSISSGSSGSGNGLMTYNVSPNVGPARNGNIVVQGMSHSISQLSGCSVSVSPATASIASGGGNATIQVQTAAGCVWQTSESVPWLSISGGSSGPGSVSISAAANPGALRQGSVTIAGQSIQVTQPPAGADCGTSLGMETRSIQSLIDNNYGLPNEYLITGVRGLEELKLEDVRFTASAGECQANDGSLKLYGFNFKVSTAGISNGELILNGMLFLPSFFTDAAGNILGSTVTLGINRNGDVRVVGGTILFPNVSIPRNSPKLSIENISVTIDTAQQIFGGTAGLGLGAGPPRGPCPITAGPRLWGAGIQFKQGRLDNLMLSVNNLSFPLGNTGAFLDSVSGEVGNLTGGNNWFVRAGLEVNAGCPIPIGTASVYPVTLNANGTITGAGYIEIMGGAKIFNIMVGEAYFRYNPKYNIAAGAKVDFLDIFIAQADIRISENSFAGQAKGKLQIPRYVPVAGGYEFASAMASFDNNGFCGSVSVSVSPEIPSLKTPEICTGEICEPFSGLVCWFADCDPPCWTPPCIPAVCTPRVPALKIRAGFCFKNGDFSFNRPAYGLESWEHSYQPVLQNKSQGNQMQFMSNWAQRDKVSSGKTGRPFKQNKGGLQVAEFTVAANEDAAIFRISWEGATGSLPLMYLVEPTGAMHPFGDGPLPLGFAALPGAFATLPIVGDDRTASAAVATPQAGNWQIWVEQTVPNISIEYLRENPAPKVRVDGVENILFSGFNTIKIDYTTEIREGNPTTRFFYTGVDAARERMQGPRFLLDEFPSQNGSFEFYPGEDYDIPSGWYHVGIVVDDPQSLRVEAVSQARVYYTNPNPVEPPMYIASRAGNGRMTIGWQPSLSPDVVNYIVYYTIGNEPTEFEQAQTVAADTLLTTINGLENGQPYLVTVVAVLADETRSRFSEVIRVIPTAGYGLTPPRIISDPDVDAVVGHNYVYRPATCDGDDARAPQALAANGNSGPPPAGKEYDEHGLRWELLEAPAGMSIGANGFVQWTPAASQVGDHPVRIRATDILADLAGTAAAELFAEQAFVLTALPANNLSGLESTHAMVLSRPPLDAYPLEQYVYTPQVLTSPGGWELELLEGPLGMSVTLDRQSIIWDVPDFSEGSVVRIKATPIGIDADLRDCAYQCWFLNTPGPMKQLPPDVAISRFQRQAGFVGLVWPGTSEAGLFQVQRSTNIVSGPWINIGPTQTGSALNIFTDADVPDGCVYYRVIDAGPIFTSGRPAPAPQLQAR